MAEQRWRHRGYPHDGIYDISFWVVIWGVIGARLYHVVTDYQLFEHDPLARVPDLARGPRHLGRGDRRGDRGRRDHAPPQDADARGDGLHGARHRARAGDRPVGQLLQPGAVREAVDAPVGAGDRAVAPADRLPAVSRRSSRRSSTSRSRASRSSACCCSSRSAASLKLGQTFALYVVLYTFARFWFENLRIDPAHEIAGMRLNAWVSIVVCLSAIAWFVWLGRHAPPQRRPGHREEAGSAAVAVPTTCPKVNRSVPHGETSDDRDAQPPERRRRGPGRRRVQDLRQRRGRSSRAEQHQRRRSRPRGSPRSWDRPVPASRRSCTAWPDSTASPAARSTSATSTSATPARRSSR